MSDKVVRLGGASGFWGDTPEGARQLVFSGQVDYLVMDYLAEITMSLLARAKAKDPNMGYPPDFVAQFIAPYAKELAARKIKVVANAGGVNPLACRDAVAKVLADQGIDLKVAAIVGDDVAPMIEELRGEGVKEVQSGAALPAKIVTANAYIGAFPIARALAEGADIVVTGRAADSALALGPLIHEFGWTPADFDRLAAGTMAGHVIECGPQATGGVFTDWHIVEGWAEIGFPIAECKADGSFVVTKPEGTGGLVSTRTVAEQITYETGDPANYILPDVICDLSHVQVEQLAPNRVLVTGVRGKAPTSTYKVSATYPEGFRSIATLMVNGINAAGKAQAMGEAILKRTRNIFAREGIGEYEDTSIEILGAEATYGPHARVKGVREVILKVGVRHLDKRAVEIFSREIAPAATGMGQGISGFAGGRPAVQPVLRLYSFLLEKSRVKLAVDFEGRRIPVEVPTEGQAVSPTPPSTASAAVATEAGETVTVPLVAIAYGRSGDKGNLSNISVMARRPEFEPAIAAQLTAEAVAAYMAHVVEGQVERYPWPGLYGFNFILNASLGGGGVASLRYDPQGKAHAQMLMDFPITVPKRWVDEGLVEFLEQAA